MDVAGLSEEDNLLVLGECKFWSGPVGVNILTELEQKAAFVDWHKGKRKTVYIIFSVNGYSEELAAVGKIREDVLYVEHLELPMLIIVKNVSCLKKIEMDVLK